MIDTSGASVPCKIDSHSYGDQATLLVLGNSGVHRCIAICLSRDDIPVRLDALDLVEVRGRSTPEATASSG